MIFEARSVRTVFAPRNHQDPDPVTAEPDRRTTMQRRTKRYFPFVF